MIKMILKYWFIQGDGENQGKIYEHETLGRIIVFDGTLAIGEPFRFMDTQKHEEVKGEEAEELAALIIEIVRDSIVNA